MVRFIGEIGQFASNRIEQQFAKTFCMVGLGIISHVVRINPSEKSSKQESKLADQSECRDYLRKTSRFYFCGRFWT